jgi:hypothetical protein
MNQPLQWLTGSVFLSILGCGTNSPDPQQVLEKSRQVQAQTEKVISDVKKSNAEIMEKMEKGK